MSPTLEDEGCPACGGRLSHALNCPFDDRVVCPRCVRTTRNIVSTRDVMPGVIGVGFRCEHCGHEWGHLG